MVQEVAAASNLSVYCVGITVSWNIYQGVFNFFDFHQDETKLLIFYGQPMKPLDAGIWFPGPGKELVREQCQKEQTSSLWLLLRDHIMYKATDSRDKVYAFQGTSDDPGLLTIDWSRDVGLVYMDAAIDFLNQGVLMDLPQYAGIGWTSLRDGARLLMTRPHFLIEIPWISLLGFQIGLARILWPLSRTPTPTISV
jgi:hypothetical protein